MGVPVVIGGDNLPSPVPKGLNDLKNIGGASGPPWPPLAPPVPASLSYYSFGHQKMWTTVSKQCILGLFFVIKLVIL